MYNVFVTQKLIAFCSYKIIWLSGVWGSTVGIAFLTPIFTALYAYWTIQQQQRKGLFMTFILSISLSGMILESMVLNHTVYLFTPARAFIPYWLMAIWVAFPCMCATSLKQPLKHPLFAIAMGSIFGPLAYQGAASMGCIELIHGIYGIGTLSLAWATVLFMIHRWIKILPDHSL